VAFTLPGPSAFAAGPTTAAALAAHTAAASARRVAGAVVEAARWPASLPDACAPTASHATSSRAAQLGPVGPRSLALPRPDSLSVSHTVFYRLKAWGRYTRLASVEGPRPGRRAGRHCPLDRGLDVRFRSCHGPSRRKTDPVAADRPHDGRCPEPGSRGGGPGATTSMV